VDVWTIVNAVIFIAGIISVILVFKKEEKDYQESRRQGESSPNQPSICAGAL